MPTLAPRYTGWSSMMKGSDRVWITASATRAARAASVVSVSSMMNSSPPRRATMSEGAAQASSRSAAILRTRSPT